MHMWWDCTSSLRRYSHCEEIPFRVPTSQLACLPHVCLASAVKQSLARTKFLAMRYKTSAFWCLS